jgi:two-component system response regulator YesN
MYNLLVVDDEEIAVRGIVQGINWSDLPINEILTAYDVAEAKQLFAEHKVHLLLSDIDMPDNNGIELLQWVKEFSPETETIFLTGHADFTYAQQALQLDSFDYLLKPIDHAHLKQTIAKALEKIHATQEQQQFHKTYEFYYQQWNKQLTVLSERFWQDIIYLRIPATPSQLVSSYSLYDIPLAPVDPVRLILISVEQWNEVLSARDEEIMTYAVQNAGQEIVLKGLKGQVLQEAGGVLVAVVYTSDEAYEQRISDNCIEFIEQCRTYLRCDVSCYVGEAVQASELHDSMRRLTAIERNYLLQGGTVIWQSKYKEESTIGVYQPSFEDWGVLLEMGKRNELMSRMEESFQRLSKSTIDPFILEGYYHGLLYTVYAVLQRKSAAVSDVYRGEEWRDTAQITKSLQRLKEWAIRYVEIAVDYLNNHSKELSSFVTKAINYIEEHLSEELSREDIANHVYLNPAYLSRLFKKETGQSLTDYILELRIAKVKPMLEKTNLKISDIAQTVGYDNFSHFTKMFKKATGLTPFEYRRKYQNVGQ